MLLQRPDPVLDKSNRVWITGILAERQPLRYTPAGIPVVELVIKHQSEQVEAGVNRQIECEVRAVVLGQVAEKLSRVDTETKLSAAGFLAAKSLKRRQDLVLHIEEFELLN